MIKRLDAAFEALEWELWRSTTLRIEPICLFLDALGALI